MKGYDDWKTTPPPGHYTEESLEEEENSSKIPGILLCPFCHSEPTWGENDEIVCDECGVIMSSYASRQQTIEAWNTRGVPK